MDFLQETINNTRQDKVSWQGICSEGGYWLQWDLFSCNQAYIYSNVIDNSSSVWSRVRADSVKTVFLHGELEEMYMKQPKGYIQEAQKKTKRVF